MTVPWRAAERPKLVKKKKKEKKKKKRKAEYSPHHRKVSWVRGKENKNVMFKNPFLK